VLTSYTDFWNNLNGDYNIADPETCTYIEGDDIEHEDPMFTDPGNDDYSLQPGSPCIGAGDPRDVDALETRADKGYIDYADDPYPAQLNRDVGGRARVYTFEMPAVGHGEFGIPFTPTDSADPDDMFFRDGSPYTMDNKILKWDNAGKSYSNYPDAWTALEVGQGYMYLNFLGGRASELDIEYAAVPVPLAGRVLIPEAGRSMIAITNGQPLWMGNILIMNNQTGAIRTSLEDKDAADPWLNWNWTYWNFASNSYDIVGFGNPVETVEPWYSYQVWAWTRDLTLILPGG
jgi:hypothetical protein